MHGNIGQHERERTMMVGDETVVVYNPENSNERILAQK